MRHAWAVLLLCGVSLAAQGTKTFKTRLSPIPIDVSMQATVAGTGAVTASLTGSKLTVAGTFEGLKSAATLGKVHRSPVRGVRGPEVFALTVTAATSGTISGTAELSQPQLSDLQAGRLYVQIHSEKAPDGNLWGWLIEKK